MRIVDMLPILEKMDSAGYYAIEAWGGATFDVCLRYLNEDPWQRLRLLKKNLPHTPIQMLLRGQNLLGYSNMADDVVTEFIKRSVDNGVSIIRIFDALNDTRNLETAIRATKEAGGHAQGCIVYTISSYHKDEDFVKLGKELVQMGADSICIKDMAGLLRPYSAYKLVKALKAEISVPIDIHTHFTSALGDMTYLKAIEAGADIVDTAISPFSCSTSQPCTESLVAALEGTDYDTGLDMHRLHELADYFKRVKRDLVEDFHLNTNIPIDPKVLTFQIPGGMLSNLLRQMKELGIADKYDELLVEMPRVRKDLCYPPLFTPARPPELPVLPRSGQHLRRPQPVDGPDQSVSLRCLNGCISPLFLTARKRLQDRILQPFVMGHLTFLLFSFLSSSPNPVDVPLKVTPVHEFRQYQLVKNRHRAGIKSHFFLIYRHPWAGKYEVPCPHGGGNGLGEGVHVNHRTSRVQGIKGILRFGKECEFRIKIVFDNVAAPFLRPADVFCPLRSTGCNTGRVAVEGSHMEYGSPAACQFFRPDAVLTHGKKLHLRPAGFIDLSYFLVGWIFQGVDTVPPQYLYIEAVEILRSGANENLVRRDRHVPAPTQVGSNGFPELQTPFAGRGIQYFLAVHGQHIPHGLGKLGKGKQIPFPFFPLLHRNGANDTPVN